MEFARLPKAQKCVPPYVRPLTRPPPDFLYNPLCMGVWKTTRHAGIFLKLAPLRWRYTGQLFEQYCRTIANQVGQRKTSLYLDDQSFSSRTLLFSINGKVPEQRWSAASLRKSPPVSTPLKHVICCADNRFPSRPTCMFFLPPRAGDIMSEAATTSLTEGG